MKILMIKQEFYPVRTVEEAVIVPKQDETTYKKLKKLGFSKSDSSDNGEYIFYFYGEDHDCQYNPFSSIEINFNFEQLTKQLFEQKFCEPDDISFIITKEGKIWLHNYFRTLLSLNEDENIEWFHLDMDERYNMFDSLTIWTNKYIYKFNESLN